MKKSGEVCKASELVVGEEAKVLNINILNKVIKRHLLDMGITKGTVLRIKKISPLGDPIDVSLRGYELALRKMELNHIEVEVI